MRKVLVIGTGGIGSFLIPLLNRLNMYEITVADPDKVETKNLTYQNFLEDDVGKNKSKVMFDRHKSIKKWSEYPVLTEKQMQGYDLVICCVDNIGLRRTLYNTTVKWLDLRAQGRNAALVSYKADPKMYDTLLAGEEGSFSCQGDSWDGSTEGVHFMQTAIAGLGAQWIQRWFNDEQVKEYTVINM
jgi:hypothetical protein